VKTVSPVEAVAQTESVGELCVEDVLEEETGAWRKLRNDLCCSPNIIRMTELKRMRWAGRFACVEYLRKVSLETRLNKRKHVTTLSELG
jgi:hypothetical protein